ncbi:MAG TPA: alpha/beta hydrolase [Solirubrobacterales bacterium]
MSATHPRRILLEDGRLLAFDEWGDRCGTPVFSFHGGISSRLDAAPLDAACRERGVRLIAPDRPGTGYSDPSPGRTLLDWPRDVAELADALGLERFGVMGWSLGGQYAAACAYALPTRVTRAALLAGVVPFEVEPGRAGLAWFDRWLLTLCRWAPPLAGLGLRIGVSLPPLAGMQRIIACDGSDADREALRRDPSPTWAAESIKQSVRAGTGGVIRDYRVWREPWGFDLGRVGVEVGVWQGDDDGFVPVTDAEALAERIPGARLVVCPGEGHISLQRNHGAEAAEWLAAPLRAARV